METMWIRFVAVSSTFLGASKVPSVNTVRESRGLAQAPVRGRGGAKCQLLPLAHGCIRGGSEEGEWVRRRKGHRHKHLGYALPISSQGRGWLVVLNGQLPPRPRWAEGGLGSGRSAGAGGRC